MPWVDGLPDDYSHLVLSRLTYGITPALLDEVANGGGTALWLQSQLSPSSIPDPAADAMVGWFPALSYDSATAYAKNADGTQPGWKTMQNFASWTMLRRMYSRRQLHETMTEFWSNLLYIPADTNSFGFRMDYDRVVRTHALGRFADLLQAAITHPAMLVYLDAAVSVKSNINENLGRELLELHTVGRAAQNEADVVNAARILTGYRVDTWRTWNSFYDPAAHWTGPVSVGGFSHANADPDGRPVVAALLAYLARHPATAQRIARRLAQFLVSDNPPSALVDRLAQLYLANDTAIAPLVTEILAAPEFRASAGAKTVTPANDVVRTVRALGITIDGTEAANAAKYSILWSAEQAGQRPFAWPRPDGEPMVAAAWTSVGRVLGSFETHWGLAGGWWPTVGITYRTRASWLPSTPIRLDALIDHVSRTMFGRIPSATMVQAVCEAVGYPPTESIGAGHAVANWRMPMLLSTLLNSPSHMMR